MQVQAGTTPRLRPCSGLVLLSQSRITLLARRLGRTAKAALIMHGVTMWKIAAAFIVFSAAALLLIMKGGDKIDMQGEAGHTSGAASAPAEAAPAASASPAAPGAMPPANAPAPAAATR
jgi:hypothetical protein